jgi:CubicO group peptidase (beta-lactamase class C family)
VTDPLGAAFDYAASQGERGIQVAAYVGEDLIVDEWRGTRDAEDRDPVDGDTLFHTFSLGKSLSALGVHLQVARGHLDYDMPIASVWPEFAAHGKGTGTVRHALTHRLGIPQMPEGVDVEKVCDWDWMVERIANLTPISPPGSSSTYLALTFGWVLGEVVRRSDPKHRAFEEFVLDEICAPIGLTDIHFGVPEDQLSRVAFLSSDTKRVNDPASDSLWVRAMPTAVALEPDVWNQRVLQVNGAPGAGALTNARTEARLWAMFANGGTIGGVRLLSEETVRSLTLPRERPDEMDPVLNEVIGFGNSGFWLGDTPRVAPMVGGTRSVICQPSSGGALGWADLDTGLAVSICHNRMLGGPRTGGHPLVRIADEVRRVASDVSV